MYKNFIEKELADMYLHEFLHYKKCNNPVPNHKSGGAVYTETGEMADNVKEEDIEACLK